MKKIPLFKVFTNKNKTLKNLDKVLDSGFINEGEEVRLLTQKLEKILENQKNILR